MRNFTASLVLSTAALLGGTAYGLASCSFNSVDVDSPDGTATLSFTANGGGSTVDMNANLSSFVEFDEYTFYTAADTSAYSILDCSTTGSGDATLTPLTADTFLYEGDGSTSFEDLPLTPDSDALDGTFVYFENNSSSKAAGCCLLVGDEVDDGTGDGDGDGTGDGDGEDEVTPGFTWIPVAIPEDWLTEEGLEMTRATYREWKQIMRQKAKQERKWDRIMERRAERKAERENGGD